MSKVLVIKNADFSENALDVVQFGTITTIQPSFTSGGVMLDGSSLALIPKISIANGGVVKSVLLGQYNAGMKGTIVVLNAALTEIVSESGEIEFSGEKTDVGSLNIAVPQGGYVGLRTIGATNNWHLNTDISPYRIIQVLSSGITPDAGTYGMDYGFEIFVPEN